LTAAAVQKYAAQTKRREIPDAKATGLYLIIQPKPKGSKSWALRFRRPDGRPAKLRLGSCDLSGVEPADEPVLGGALTLGQARQLAAKVNRDRARGIDVVEAHKAKRSRDHAAAAAAAANSFGAVAHAFFINHKTNKWQARPRRWRGDARLLGLAWSRDCDPAHTAPDVIPGSLAAIWAAKPIAAIDAHDVYTVIDEARRLGIPGLLRRNGAVSDARGRKMHAALSGVFRWAMQHRKVVNNPTVGVWHPDAPPARERVLTDDELRALWRACDAVGAPYGPLLKVLLLTGCRLNEVAGMQHSELADGVWTVPAARTKNHRPHALALPPLVLAIIAAQPRFEGSPYVWGNRPPSGWSRAKAQVDELMGGAVPPWRIHDLRRTCASGMQKLGVRPEVVERCLNHVSGVYRGVAGIYQLDPMLAETRAALARWAAHVQGLVTGKPANVVPLPRKRKARP
jgi:integrase